jgi:hypothetical protein
MLFLILIFRLLSLLSFKNSIPLLLWCQLSLQLIPLHSLRGSFRLRSPVSLSISFTPISFYTSKMKIATILAALSVAATATPTEKLQPRQTTSGSLPIVSVQGNGM